ncbi:MAG TPA: hypothetical protein VE153_22945, partial [Myxococcus sp.]|nr:hypothetical protein [Myxococcus sp.]
MSSSLPRSAPSLLLASALCLLASTEARAQVGLRGPRPPASSPGARFALFRQCPRVENVLEAELTAGDSTQGVWLQRGWWRSAAARRSGDFIELREEGAGLENVRRVNLRACSVLGYSWATFDGGRGLPGVFTGVSLFREGRRVTWSGLGAAERSTLLKLMRAREGDAREATLVGALFRAWEAGQVRPPAAAPALRKQARLEPAFPPRAEGRVFIPCVDGSPACGGALGGNLQPGTRLRRQEPL